jgi:DNA-binding beta-propeller fold protein YncE
MYRRALIRACLTLLWLLAVGMPAVASPRHFRSQQAEGESDNPSGWWARASRDQPRPTPSMSPTKTTTRCRVINGKKNRVVATIPVGFEPQGVATNPQTNTIYVTNTNGDFSGTLSVISGQTNTVTGMVSVGPVPVGVATNPMTNR